MIFLDQQKDNNKSIIRLKTTSDINTNDILQTVNEIG